MKIKDRIAIGNCKSKSELKRQVALRGLDLDEALKFWEEAEKAWDVEPDAVPKPRPPTPLAPQDK